MLKYKQIIGFLLLFLSIVLIVSCALDRYDNCLGNDFLERAHESIKNAYGDDYLPSVSIEPLILQEKYGINLGQVDAVIAEEPLMSVHMDTFIGIRAVEGEAESIERILLAYKDKLIQESIQYPMNQSKVEAAKVYRIKDHVFFFILGATYKTDLITPEEKLEFAKDQVQIAIDAIEEML